MLSEPLAFHQIPPQPLHEAIVACSCSYPWSGAARGEQGETPARCECEPHTVTKFPKIILQRRVSHRGPLPLRWLWMFV